MRTPAPSVIHNYLCWEKRKPIYTNYYLTPKERRELITDAGLNGLLLFEYYLTLIRQDQRGITDAGAMEWFGWSLATVQRWRQKLTSTDWYYSEKARMASGKVSIIHYLGKAAVMEAKEGCE